MERNLLLKDKKGVSIMVGYVILIVIAISLSVAVFAYLKLYLPEKEPDCPEDVILAIDSVTCRDSNGDGWFDIDVTLSNRGFFSVDGAFIRMGEVGRIFKKLLNENPIGLFVGEPGNELAPGQGWSSGVQTLALEISDYTVLQEIEVEPLILIEGRAILCESAVVNKIVQCEIGPPEDESENET
jgi:hypothetical protein